MPHSNRMQDEPTDDQILTDPSSIARIMDELDQQSAILTVRSDPEGPLLDSSLVRVDAPHQRIYLDEFRPEGKPPVRAGHDLTLFVTQRGVVMRFAVTLERFLIEQGRIICETHFPTAIHLFQRREIFRVHLPIYDRREVRIHHLDAETDLVGRLVDLSIKGFCLEVPETEIRPDQIGTIYRYAGMQLPETRSALTGDASMVNLRPSPHSGFVYVGFNILDMDPLTERALMRAALFYQRDARKAGT